MSIAYRAGRIWRKIWNGPFHIGHLSQPVTVGDVLMKVLETAWRTAVVAITIVVVMVACGGVWFTYLSPVIFPRAETKLVVEAVYDNGKRTIPAPPPLVKPGQKAPPVFRCTPDYPIKVSFWNKSSRPITDVYFDIEAYNLGYTNNLVDGGAFRENHRVVEPHHIWTTCYASPALEGVDPMELTYKANVSTASYADE
ncbi:hypothetical protein EDF58_1011343 [Novosphingobium sp. PhB57]|uniref:hypothetical protein n=1 Tax=Novosphingobium sp. PhB57 TaxID=2485107 RepID=UPI0010494DCF|nr:hypothetical protein [Novosphingobium sp. PhB57]TCU62010.1 hypothetical protein EDF58_1011343 [Novosphingobium sp. PhB57]